MSYYTEGYRVTEESKIQRVEAYPFGASGSVTIEGVAYRDDGDRYTSNAGAVIFKSHELALAAVRDAQGGGEEARRDQSETGPMAVSSADTQGAGGGIPKKVVIRPRCRKVGLPDEVVTYLLQHTVEQVKEDMYTAHLLAAPDMSVGEIAKAMGMGRATLYRKIHKWEEGGEGLRKYAHHLQAVRDRRKS